MAINKRVLLDWPKGQIIAEYGDTDEPNLIILLDCEEVITMTLDSESVDNLSETLADMSYSIEQYGLRKVKNKEESSFEDGEKERS